MKFFPLLFFLCISFWVEGQQADTVVVRMEIDSLIAFSNDFIRTGKYERALEIIQEAKQKCLHTFGPETAILAKIVFLTGRAYSYQGDLSKAESLYLQSKNLQEKTIGKDHADYAWTLEKLGLLYSEMGDFEKAESFYLESIAIREKVMGNDHPRYAWSLDRLAILYCDTGNYKKAERFHMEAKAIREKVLGKNSRDYAVSLDNLAILFTIMCNYEKAESYYLEASSIFKKEHGVEHHSYALSLNNLGILYNRMGKYEEAELCYSEAKTILGKNLTKDHPHYANNLNNLAELASHMGNYEKAELFYKEGLETTRRTLGEEAPGYAFSLNNLAGLYNIMGKNDQAEQLYLAAIKIFEKAVGTEHPDYAKTTGNLGALYLDVGQFEKAEKLLTEGKRINEKVLGDKHPSYASSLYSLANLYRTKNLFAEAESYYLEAKSIRENALGKGHPEDVNILNDLSNLYWKTHRFKEASQYLQESMAVQKSLLTKATRHLSEQELGAYSRFFLQSFHLHFSLTQRWHERGIDQNSYSLEAEKETADLSAACYDYALFHKGFLLTSSNQIKRLSASDPTTTEQFNSLKAYYRRLTDQYSKPVEMRKGVAELEENVNQLEKELVRSVAGFGEVFQEVTWGDVQEQLRPKEAAIEFIHYRLYTPDPTDTIRYAAVLLQPEEKGPLFIPLFDEEVLNALIQSYQNGRPDYVNDIYNYQKQEDQKPLHQLIWQPLDKYLAGVQTIYFSPSGLLHRLNIGAITDKSKVFYMDRYQLIQLNSTRQLALPVTNAFSANDATLFGGIQYDMDSTSIAQVNADFYETYSMASRGDIDFQEVAENSDGNSWKYLKWTAIEVAANGQILESANFKTDVKMGIAATEEAFRQLEIRKASPRILHLSTHGFFYPDPIDKQAFPASSNIEPVFKLSDHPMIRSGLIMAGGNHVWQGNPPLNNMEDGILTAYEISQMDLSNTELVVLSACETGLGDIQGNEGVYGLQRAFKIAGAKYLIMSLWQVPDFQTQELMTTFYTRWLLDKMPIRKAFQTAQKEMREKHVDPFYWAGFVLVE